MHAKPFGFTQVGIELYGFQQKLYKLWNILGLCLKIFEILFPLNNDLETFWLINFS